MQYNKETLTFTIATEKKLGWNIEGWHYHDHIGKGIYKWEIESKELELHMDFLDIFKDQLGEIIQSKTYLENIFTEDMYKRAQIIVTGIMLESCTLKYRKNLKDLKNCFSTQLIKNKNLRIET